MRVRRAPGRLFALDCLAVVTCRLGGLDHVASASLAREVQSVCGDSAVVGFRDGGGPANARIAPGSRYALFLAITWMAALFILALTALRLRSAALRELAPRRRLADGARPGVFGACATNAKSFSAGCPPRRSMATPCSGASGRSRGARAGSARTGFSTRSFSEARPRFH